MLHLLHIILQLDFSATYLGYDAQKVLKGSVKGINQELAELLYSRGLCTENPNEYLEYLRLAASWGSQKARDSLFEIELRNGQYNSSN